MQIRFRRKKDKKTCTDIRIARKMVGTRVADKLMEVMEVINNSRNLEDLSKVPVFKFHPLKGTRKGQFSIDLGRKSGWRLIVLPIDHDGKEIEFDSIKQLYEVTEVLLVWEVSNHYE